MSRKFFLLLVVIATIFGLGAAVMFQLVRVKNHNSAPLLGTVASAQSIDIAALKTEYRRYFTGTSVPAFCLDAQCNPRFCVNAGSIDGTACTSDSQCGTGQCYDNWWEQEIGCPQWLASAVINNQKQYLSNLSCYRPPLTGSGANGAWKGLAHFSVGLARDDAQMVLDAADFMSRGPAEKTVPGSNGGEGITLDGGFYTHHEQQQNHYGSQFLGTMANYMAITENDPATQVQNKPNITGGKTADQIICSWIDDYVRWVNAYDAGRGQSFWDPLTSSKSPNSTRDRFTGGVRTLLNDTNYCSSSVRAGMAGIVGSSAESVGAMSFPVENYLAVKRPGLTAGLRMTDLGSPKLEASPVNPLFGAVSWVTPATMDKWYGDRDSGGDSIAEYPHRLLGLSTIPRSHASNVVMSGDAGAVPGVIRNNWPYYAQSTLAGYSGVGSVYFRGGDFTIKKSWFFFDNEIVSLGSDIADAGGIDTWLNSFVKRDANVVSSSGTVPVPTRSASEVDSGAWLTEVTADLGTLSWLYHDSTGYVFPETERVRARGIRTAYKGPMSQVYLAHTQDNFQDYAVVFLPGASQAQTQGYNGLQIIEHSGNAHVVKDVSSNTVGAVVFTSRAYDGVVSSNLPADILYSTQGSEVRFSLYNPHLETQTAWWNEGGNGNPLEGENPKDDWDIPETQATRHQYAVTIPPNITGFAANCTGNACGAFTVGPGGSTTVNVNLRVSRKLEFKAVNGQIVEATIGLNDAEAGTASAPPPPPVCGNGQCESGETNQTCPADCSASNLPPQNLVLTYIGPTPGSSACGNGACEAGETAQSCPADCTSPPPPPPAGE